MNERARDDEIDHERRLTIMESDLRYIAAAQVEAKQQRDEHTRATQQLGEQLRDLARQMTMSNSKMDSIVHKWTLIDTLNTRLLVIEQDRETSRAVNKRRRDMLNKGGLAFGGAVITGLFSSEQLGRILNWFGGHFK